MIWGKSPSCRVARQPWVQLSRVSPVARPSEVNSRKPSCTSEASKIAFWPPDGSTMPRRLRNDRTGSVASSCWVEFQPIRHQAFSLFARRSQGTQPIFRKRAVRGDAVPELPKHLAELLLHMLPDFILSPGMDHWRKQKALSGQGKKSGEPGCLPRLSDGKRDLHMAPFPCWETGLRQGIPEVQDAMPSVAQTGCGPHVVAHLPELQPKSLITMEMVGDPGIEPGVGRPGGVTVPCRTLQLVARRGWVYPRGRGASRVDRCGREGLFGLHRGLRVTHCPGRNSGRRTDGSGRKEAGMGGRERAWRTA